MQALVLDTNTLFLFVVGTVDPTLLGTAKRLKEYEPDDLGVVETYLSLFRSIVLLPNVVTETSNLIGQMTAGRRDVTRRLLADLIRSGEESYVQSTLAVDQPEYMELGLTDAAILCALDDQTSLLTADLRLYVAALSRDRSAEYFGNLRP